jgi:glyoxylase-like metal-dependent hydrolase (beta-lactamase superfamily II)
MEILSDQVARIPVFFGENGNGLVNVYLVRGEKIGLIDTGVAGSPERWIGPALKQIGLGLEDVDFILNTHGHSDHIGGNAEVKELSDARIHLHRHDLFTADGVDSYMRGPSDNSAPLRVLGRDDLLAARRPRMVQNLGKEFHVDRVLEDGDRIDLGRDVVLDVVHTPGHTLGHVSFFWEPQSMLFSGDAIQGYAHGLPSYFFAPEYRASVKRVQDMAVETLCMAHAFEWTHAINLPVRRGDEIAQTLRDSLDMSERIGSTVKSIMKERAEIGLVDLAWAVLDELRWVQPVQYHRELGAMPTQISSIMAHWMEERGVDPRTA